jgi:hypothetical protein
MLMSALIPTSRVLTTSSFYEWLWFQKGMLFQYECLLILIFFLTKNPTIVYIRVVVVVVSGNFKCQSY